MEDTRKYFDYELAYEGYTKVKELLENGGIQAVIEDEEFNISYGATIEEWSCNGYIPIVASGYNATIYISDRNFDTNNEENDWYVSGEVDIISYGYREDNLYINSKKAIEERIIKLLDFAKKNDYTLDDTFKEYESLVKVLQKINIDEYLLERGEV